MTEGKYNHRKMPEGIWPHTYSKTTGEAEEIKYSNQELDGGGYNIWYTWYSSIYQETDHIQLANMYEFRGILDLTASCVCREIVILNKFQENGESKTQNAGGKLSQEVERRTKLACSTWYKKRRTYPYYTIITRVWFCLPSDNVCRMWPSIKMSTTHRI